MSKEFKSVLCDSVEQVQKWYQNIEIELREPESLLKEALTELEKQKKATHEQQRDGYSVHLIKKVDAFKKYVSRIK